jgi:uncharacterized glyoxalase superfamily protein PhnB
MPARSVDAGITAVPALRYRDLPAAISWLCQVLGFDERLVVHNDDGTVRYAELTLGNSMVMLGPVRGSAFDELMVQPDEVGGAETQVCCFFVPDADAYCARAKAAGAEIVLELSDKFQRGRGFSCRDPEGHLWSFGTYDPWRHRSIARRDVRRPSLPAAVLAALSVAVVASLAAAGGAYSAKEHTLNTLGIAVPAGTSVAGPAMPAADLLPPERVAPAVTKSSAHEADEKLAHALQRATAGEQAAADLRRELTELGSAREAAERSHREGLAELARQKSERQAAERALEEARGELTREQSARQAAQRTNQWLQLRLARAREATAPMLGPGHRTLFDKWVPNVD